MAHDSSFLVFIVTPGRSAPFCHFYKAPLRSVLRSPIHQGCRPDVETCQKKPFLFTSVTFVRISDWASILWLQALQFQKLSTNVGRGKKRVLLGILSRKRPPRQNSSFEKQVFDLTVLSTEKISCDPFTKWPASCVSFSCSKYNYTAIDFLQIFPDTCKQCRKVDAKCSATILAWCQPYCNDSLLVTNFGRPRTG